MSSACEIYKHISSAPELKKFCLDSIWGIIYDLGLLGKATYTWAVNNWRPKDCVAEDSNIKDSVWGEAPAKFLTIMFENFEQIEALSCLMFDF